VIGSASLTIAGCLARSLGAWSTSKSRQPTKPRSSSPEAFCQPISNRSTLRFSPHGVNVFNPPELIFTLSSSSSLPGLFFLSKAPPECWVAIRVVKTYSPPAAGTSIVYSIHSPAPSQPIFTRHPCIAVDSLRFEHHSRSCRGDASGRHRQTPNAHCHECDTTARLRRATRIQSGRRCGCRNFATRCRLRRCWLLQVVTGCTF
jgi:hypothetical protein